MHVNSMHITGLQRPKREFLSFCILTAGNLFKCLRSSWELIFVYKKKVYCLTVTKSSYQTHKVEKTVNIIFWRMYLMKEHINKTGLQWVNVKTQSVFSPADLEVWTIMKSWILHYLELLVIGFISALISCTLSILRWIQKCSIIKCSMNGSPVLFIWPTGAVTQRWTLADFSYRAHGEETKEKGDWSGGLCYPFPRVVLIFAAPLNLSVFTAGRCKLGCFLRLRLTSAFCEEWYFLWNVLGVFCFFLYFSILFNNDTVPWVRAASELTGDEGWTKQPTVGHDNSVNHEQRQDDKNPFMTFSLLRV